MSLLYSCCMDLYHLRQGLHVIASSWDYHGGAESRVSVRGNSVRFTSRRVHGDGSENENLQLGANPRLLHRVVRRALLGGCALGAHQLGGCLTPIHHRDGGARFPGCSRAALPTSPMAGVSPWPPPAARETCMSWAPPPRIIND
jgi:hypothetical protein